MSIRRRAIRERIERTAAKDAMFALWKSPDDPINKLAALVRAKIEAGDKSLTREEVEACFAVPTSSTQEEKL